MDIAAKTTRPETLLCDAHEKCFRSFKDLMTAVNHPSRNLDDQLSSREVENMFDQYKIWAGNVGAMHRGTRYQISLDYRLSQADFYKRQIQKAFAVVQGVREPAEEIDALDAEDEQYQEELSEDPLDDPFEDSPWEISDSEGSDDIVRQTSELSNQVGTVGPRKPTMEVPYLLSEIGFIISCLYKLPLRDPAPHDRFVGEASADMPLYQHFDILYVKDKFPLANPILATRLGKMVTRRRQLLASRLAHDERLMSGNDIVEESFSNMTSETNRPIVIDAKNADDSGRNVIEKISRSQFSSTRQTTLTKATLRQEKFKSEDNQVNSSLENISEYAPSMASSHAAKLHIKVPKRPQDEKGCELEDFKCPYCFIACHVETQAQWKQHVLRDIQPYVCTFQGCELYESLFAKKDEWFQHETQNHRLEWKCGQEDHPSFTNRVHFLRHMSASHNISIDASQSAIFSGMFEIREYKQTGICCLCSREAKNLKTHLAHHLEQIALFALPRQNDILEVDSDINVRGSVDASSEEDSLDSENERTESLDRFSPEGREEATNQFMESSDEYLGLVDQMVAPEPAQSNLGFSWTEVYQELRPSDTEDDRDKLRGFAINSLIPSDPNSEISLSHQESQEDQQSDIRRWLSAPDPSSNYNRALAKRYAKTGEWLFADVAYVKWLSKPTSFLWIYGIPGSGKTTLSSVVIQETQIYRGTRHDVTLYFFFGFDDVEKQQQEQMIRSLIMQLFAQNASVQQTIESLYSSCYNGERQPAYDSLLAALHESLRSFDQTYIVLDALDECSEMTKLFDTIKTFMSWRDLNLHVLITSRQEKDIDNFFESLENNRGKVCIQDAIINVDLSAYIHSRLQMDGNLRRWRGRPEIQQEIKDTLIDKADGMFRWVACQLDSLGNCINLVELRTVLASLPQTLGDTYAMMLSNISKDHYQYAFKILKWLTCSARPLKLEELAEVIAIDADDDMSSPVRPEQRFKEPQDILSICPGLIALQDSRHADIEHKGQGVTVRIAHFSIREYLVSDMILHGSAKYYSINELNANISIYSGCLAYLSALDDSHLSTERLAELPLALYAAKYWTLHACAVERNSSFNPHSTERFLLARKNVFQNSIRLYDPDKPDAGPNLDRSSSGICSPLYYISQAGLVQSVQMLLDKGADPNVQGGRYGNSLQAASYKGHFEIVLRLLESGANINAKGGEYGNSLQAAVFGGHERVVRILLEKGADIEARGGEYVSSLQAAVIQGHESMVRILLDSGADPNARDSSPLKEAISRGHKVIARLLLEKGASVDALITVCGMTGSGKSTFIDKVGMTGNGKSTAIETVGFRNVNVEQGWKSRSAQIQEVTCEVDGQLITLVEAPGFSEPDHSDYEVLQMIADWTELLYSKGMLLSGLIYLHRITESRVRNSSIKNFRMFQELCGTESMNNVMLVTTMWESIDSELGKKREEQLYKEGRFWGTMVAQGATVKRHDNTQRTALRLVNSLLKKTPIALKIQKQLVDENKLLIETSVGAELNKALRDMENGLLSTMQQEKDRMLKTNEKALQESEVDLSRLKAKLELNQKQQSLLRGITDANLQLEFQRRRTLLRKPMEKLECRLTRRSLIEEGDK